ncbi:alpha/beta fold hydrolase [Bradyrhizobium cytisi]|uniref:Alpha/beta hydrolase n=1 Tax=Bradyrhizobium cytisi TaxID=515489 RepID=A0A5S4WMM2_9BRAD|nr:alpha/beta hydrolase [Bradyrhizobium cytisi]TYL83366.1 alpha/beta hydrolase [Bradyrhizobium cytisi]
MLEPEQLVCRTNELDIAYERTGPVDGRPLVLVHGWPDNVRCWDKTIAGLGGHKFCIYAPYLRGSGPPQFLHDSIMRSGAIAALTLDLSQFLDALNLNDVVLAGYGWGARAAYGVAALFPQRLAALVTAAAGYATAIPPRDSEFFKNDDHSGELDGSALWQHHWNEKKGRSSMNFCTPNAEVAMAHPQA